MGNRSLAVHRPGLRAAAALRVLAISCGVAAACAPGCTGSSPAPATDGSDDPARPGSIALLVAPEDGTTSILSAIRSARRRVLVEMYMLTDPDALAALLTVHDAGCEVRVLLEPAPYGDAAANQAAFSLLAAAGIDVRWAARAAGLVHAKLVVIDDVTAFVMTMNLTQAGLGSNREYAIVDRDPVDVAWARAIWSADATGGDPGSAIVPTRLLVAPIDARPRLTAVIDGARSSLAIEIEELSDGGLVSRLIAAHDRGVSVTVAVPASGRSAATTTAVARMVGRGVAVRLLATPTLHAKAMVVDGRQAYVGSVNFTRASLDDNREVGLLVKDPDVVARLAETIAADTSAASRP